MTDAHSSLDVDTALARVSAGEHLSADDLTGLAETPDILPLGMLADAVRRRICGTSVSFVRVALVDPSSSGLVIPGPATEIRLTGAPATLDLALAALTTVKGAAGDRFVSGFSWLDVVRWAAGRHGCAAVLAELGSAGLDALAEVPLDVDDALEPALGDLGVAGLAVRLTVSTAAPVDVRLRQLLRAANVPERFPHVLAVAPLPMSLNSLRPTTGYDDVKAVALARLALPRVPHVQVDWLRYGPKLAQVALTFGADDLDNVSASDDAPDGRRRAPIEELRQNIESAGFTAVERDGRFSLLG